MWLKRLKKQRNVPAFSHNPLLLCRQIVSAENTLYSYLPYREVRVFVTYVGRFLKRVLAPIDLSSGASPALW